MNNYWKFGLLMVAIVGTLLWLAVGGVKQTETYYKTIKEIKADGRSGQGQEAPRGRRHRREFDHARRPRSCSSPWCRMRRDCPVVYSGIDPLPDTFKDGAQALADGKLGTRRRVPRHQDPGQVRFEV